ncbi:MAG: DciA family protein [Methylobacter sp.]|nr:DciA family protein [Methylobacter sp.]
MAKKTIPFKAALAFPNRTIVNLYSQVEHQKLLLQVIRTVLPETLAKYARHCVINNKKLLIYTDSANWASQLRFYNTEILAAIPLLTRQSIEVMQIKIISEQTGISRQPGEKAIIPSAENIEIIRNHSFAVPDNQLKLALLKLSATLERLSG